MLKGKKPQESFFGEQLLSLLLQHLGASQDVNSGLSPWQRTEDCIVNSVCAKHLCPGAWQGRGCRTGKSFAHKKPDLQGNRQNMEHVQFSQASSLGTAQRPHSEHALGEGTGEKKSQLAEGKLS